MYSEKHYITSKKYEKTSFTKAIKITKPHETHMSKIQSYIN